jgi:type I site-specific restriction-modification system R (restriction) subunit
MGETCVKNKKIYPFSFDMGMTWTLSPKDRRVMRQVHFSTKTPSQTIDVVILLNGLPIVSVELKNHFTGQNVQHAIAQYRRRDKNEPFWRRCLVHFAVDDDAAYMTTSLAGPDTAFLPFNRDTSNPMIPNRYASSDKSRKSHHPWFSGKRFP